jgi:hypothetical protein
MIESVATVFRWLGRKFLFCTGTSVLVVVGSRVAKHGTFDMCSWALVAVAGIFCGGNVLAGKFGLPGKSVQDTKDQEPGTGVNG